jgi:hypothetical protein
MYKRSVLELSLDSVVIAVEDGPVRRVGTRIVMARLIWPRPAIAERVALMPLAFNGLEGMPESGDWTSRILFKETIQGPFGVELSVTGPVTGTQLADFLRFAGAGFMNAAGKAVAGAAESGMTSALAGLPMRYLETVLKQAGKKRTPVVATGLADLRPDGALAGGKMQTVAIPLQAPRPLYRATRTRRHGELKLRRRRILDGGEPNGLATLKARLYV